MESQENHESQESSVIISQFTSTMETENVPDASLDENTLWVDDLLEG